jgi:hypothetical protein
MCWAKQIVTPCRNQERKKEGKRERRRKGEIEEKRREEKRKEVGRRNRTKRKEQNWNVRNLAGAHFSFFGMSLPFSLQPLVHEADERDHVGPFVSRFPISVCTPEDHDEVELRSSSTKDETLCPVSG